MNKNERIKKVRAHFCEDSNKNFALKMEEQPNTVNNWIRSGYSVGDGVLYKICSKFPELNPTWLLTGEGKMLKTQATSSEQENIKRVPLLPIEAVAGFASGDMEGVNYDNCEQYAIPEFEKSGCEFLIRVSGSSMYPKYSNGDVLACKKIHDILFFQWGKVYVIDSSQGALVKRVIEDKNCPDNIMLVSDNKENYPPFSMPKSDIRSLSIVLGVIRME